MATKLPTPMALLYQAGRLLEADPAIGTKAMAAKLIAFGRQHCADWEPKCLQLAQKTAETLACEDCQRHEPHFCKNGVHHAFGVDTPNVKA